MVWILAILCAAAVAAAYLGCAFSGPTRSAAAEPGPLLSEASTPSKRTISPRRVAFGAIGLLVGVGILYATGGINQGYISENSSDTYFSHTSWLSHGWGTKTVWAGQGRNIEVDYDVALKSGELNVWIRKGGPFSPLDEHSIWYRTIVDSGSGQIHVPIRQSGLYTIYIHEQTRKGKFEASYTVRWRVR
jgi:hypothetical protein